jgi:hypothetical protein
VTDDKPIVGLPLSKSEWKMCQLDRTTLVAVSEDHGAYLIYEGKAEPIIFHGAVLSAHAQFGGDLAEMQVRYDRPDVPYAEGGSGQ